jgi:hypothetical protein
MQFKNIVLNATAAAALLAFAGGAYAAGPEPDTSAPPAAGAGPSSTTPPPPPDILAPFPDRLGAKPAQPPASIVGKDVVNAAGDKIGSVSKIDGNQVIVSVGGFLGIGSHDVALAWNQLNLSGSGDQQKLETSLSKDELKAMPEYKEPRSSSTTGGSTGSRMSR